ncbi:MAG TPA: RHS repeat-associated core domain-containing protein [Fimbriimonas sp.]|nr:RHS repeat-associated core domain-containing protein [Fimbriimonas sp.]
MAMSAVYTNFCGMIVSETRSGVERDYVPDTLGSTAALVDNTEAVTDRWEYWPYGEVSQRTGTSATPFTFVGMLGYFKDVLDKLFYVRARYLKPNLARWLTSDPLFGSTLQASSYAYCGSAPTFYIDPLGLLLWDLQTWLKLARDCGKAILSMLPGIIKGITSGGGDGLRDLCSLSAACIGGIIGVLATLLFEGLGPGLADCVGGAIGGIISSLGDKTCHGGGSFNCWVAAALIGAANGCISGVLGESGLASQAIDVVRAGVWSLLGVDETCEEAERKDPCPPLARL